MLSLIERRSPRSSANTLRRPACGKLEREIGKVCRKVARKKAELEKKFKPVKVVAENVRDFLRVPKIFNEGKLKKDQIGIVTVSRGRRSAATSFLSKALKTKGKGKLMLTGQIGEVMQESAQAAYSYAKARATELGIDQQVLDEFDIHIHLPEGAIPKDGPSAGITMATAMVSVLTQKPVRRNVAYDGRDHIARQRAADRGRQRKVARGPPRKVENGHFARTQPA
jgi:ATP-dependent Lon protease